MKDLQQEQREMRARMTSTTVKEKQKSTNKQLSHDNTDLDANDIKKLQKQIDALESENRELKAQIESLRRQKIVYVETGKSPEAQRREQQHNYFKYSNARRW